MSKRPVLDLNKPALFSPKVEKDRRIPIDQVRGITLSKNSGSAIEAHGVFSYDGPTSGIKSTQQLGVDFSLFENHTFFNSAEAKVNVAFDQIVNNYPFDGTKRQLEIFLDNLTGFEKYVLDSFPKNIGYLKFSGSQVGEHAGKGSYISVIDSAGSIYPNLSKNNTGQTILDPKDSKSMAFEFQLMVPEKSNDNQIVIQRASSENHGITIAISGSSSNSNCEIIFSVVSSSHYLSASTYLDKGKFNHFYAELNRQDSKNKLKLIKNNKIEVTSSLRANVYDFDFSGNNFLIGSGTSINLDGNLGLKKFTPFQTLSGAMDELRVFHGTRTKDDLEKYENREIFGSNDLKLYFKFNEADGEIGPNNVVLDSSGNSLHSLITNFNLDLRRTGSLNNPANPMINERLDLAPVLFPAYEGVANLNRNLLHSASNYDDVNPNMITRLIPRHYFEEASIQRGEDICQPEGSLGNHMSGSTIPGSADIGSAQILSSFLFVWAKYFDEMKMFNDYFSKLLTMDYDQNDTIPDQFLQFYSRYFGFELPNLFRNATLSQYVHGENILGGQSKTIPLYDVQNQIWRRILTNLNEIIQSKGTVHGIKALIRSIGINPENNFRIREFGGPSSRRIKDLRERKTEVSSVIDFSGSLAPVARSNNAQGISSNIPFIISDYLSSSRVEVGSPEPQGSFLYDNYINPTHYGIHGVSNNLSDGLFTSGSYTVEGTYVFPKSRQKLPVTQSVARLQTTGTYSGLSSGHGVIANLLVVSSSHLVSSSVKMITSPAAKADSPIFELALTGVNLFDGNPWKISFGRAIPDDLDFCSFQSSSYFLRCARQSFGEIKEVFQTSSMFLEHSASENNVLQNISAQFNPSGTFLVIGSQSFEKTDMFLNSSASNDLGRESNFGGLATQIRMWSKALELEEWKDHVINFKSVGVKDPRTNFNFHTHRTGAFSRLRLDCSTDQPITMSNSSGEISITDFSQNILNMQGSGFESSKEIIKPKTFYYSHLTPKFDILQTDNKVRVRSLYNPKSLKDQYYTVKAPLYEIPKSEEPSDDVRFSIDISSVMALDEDIINIFSTLDFFDNAMGNMNTLFVEDYPDIVQARKVYFNRLIHKINLKHFFEFFKWFDTSMGEIIRNMVPKKTNYFGINFVIESHVLERNKFVYPSIEIHRAQASREFVDNPPREKDRPVQTDFFGRLKKW
jgi:hypothetical protein